jgi:hypothetical protein
VERPRSPPCDVGVAPEDYIAHGEEGRDGEGRDGALCVSGQGGGCASAGRGVLAVIVGAS